MENYWPLAICTIICSLFCIDLEAHGREYAKETSKIYKYSI